MSAWSWASIGFLICLIPCGILCLFFRKPMDRVIGLGMATMISAFAFMALSIEGNLTPGFDLAVVTVLLGFGGSLVFVRFLERWD